MNDYNIDQLESHVTFTDSQVQFLNGRIKSITTNKDYVYDVRAFRKLSSRRPMSLMFYLFGDFLSLIRNGKFLTELCQPKNALSSSE